MSTYTADRRERLLATAIEDARAGYEVDPDDRRPDEKDEWYASPNEMAAAIIAALPADPSVAELLERLADAAAEAVTNPRLFHESAHRQHALSVHVAAARAALRAALDEKGAGEG